MNAATLSQIYLHIGSPKTGTSALQYFLLQNRDILSRLGFYYPPHHVDPNGISSGNAEPLARLVGEDVSQTQRLISEIMSTNSPNIILSSEYLYHIKGEKLVKLKELLAHANVKVVVYLRRQDSMLVSVYHQQIKRHGGKFTMDTFFPTYRQERYANKAVERWACVFGKENIFVHPYEEEQFRGGTIFSDFLYGIGLEDLSDFQMPSKKINKGYDRDALEFKRLFNHLPIEKYQFQLDKVLQEYSDGYSDRNSFSDDLISPDGRIEILKFHEANNAFVAQTFLGRSDGKLYYAPWPDTADSWRPYPGLSAKTARRIAAYIKHKEPRLFSDLKHVVFEKVASEEMDIRNAALILKRGFREYHPDIRKVFSKILTAWATKLHIKTSRYFLKRKGFCPVCKKKTRFISKQSWLRDHYQCSYCISLPRERALHTALDTRVLGWEKLCIHEGFPANRHVADKAVNYSASQYFPDKVFGERYGAFQNENLEQLTFPDNTFDLFITLDVLEHVFFPDKAVKEMIRVIRSGGWCVFTAPVYKELKKTRQRARLAEDGTIEHLMEPVYHGNPIGDGRSLATWDYGEDFKDIVENWTGKAVIRINQVDEYRGIEGEFLDVFLIHK